MKNKYKENIIIHCPQKKLFYRIMKKLNRETTPGAWKEAGPNTSIRIDNQKTLPCLAWGDLDIQKKWYIKKGYVLITAKEYLGIN